MKPFSLYAVIEKAVFRLPGCADMPIGCTGDDSSPPSIATVTKWSFGDEISVLVSFTT